MLELYKVQFYDNKRKKQLKYWSLLFYLQNSYNNIEENYRKSIVVDEIPCIVNIVDTAGQVCYYFYLIKLM